MQKIYKATTYLCEVYDTSKEFFLRKKDNGTFIKNIHYITNEHTIRWDIQAIHEWWTGEVHTTKDVDDILNKVMPS